jgi:uncharacterized protein (DUF2147 family)
MKYSKMLMFALVAILVSNVVTFAQDADALIGLWAPSSGKARVQIFKQDGKYLGRIVWLREPVDPATGKPKVDKNNEDEAKRSKPLLGYMLLDNFVFKSEDKLWEDGTIYDPENGSTYKCKITMPDNNTLDVRGFIGVSLFGRTDTWKRLQIK